MIKESIVDTVMVDCACDECEKGMMRPTGEAYHQGSKSYYKHICNDCAHIASFHTNYPRIEYRQRVDT